MSTDCYFRLRYPQHRNNTSFLRGCDPLEESKQELGSYRSYYTSFDPPPHRVSEARQPRSHAGFSSREIPPSAAAPLAEMPALPTLQNVDDAEAEDAQRQARYSNFSTYSSRSSPQQHFPARPDSPRIRKRKSSWPSNGEEMEVESYESTSTNHSRNSVERKTISSMNPVAASGIPAGERLPGIAHLDEQMHTPWSIENARRNTAIRGSGSNNEDPLRRLSSQSFNQSSGRSWRSSIYDSISSTNCGGGTERPPSPLIMKTSGRPVSPYHGSYNVVPSRPQPHQQGTPDQMSRSRGASPSTSYRIHHTSFEGGQDSAYGRRASDRPDDRYRSAGSHAHLPALSYHPDERRPHDSREDLFRRSPQSAQEQRASFSSGEPNMDNRSPEYLYNHSSNSNNRARQSRVDGSLINSRPVYQYEAPSFPVGKRGSHERYERDSPSAYYEELGHQSHSRLESNTSPRHHPYSTSGGASTSPNVPRRRGKLPKMVTDLLKSWLLDHASHPYPTEDEKRRLCDLTGLSISQVSNWFINARRRILVPQGSGNFTLGHPILQSGGGDDGSLHPHSTLHSTPSPPLHPLSPHPHQQRHHSH
ncbi:hypothetical protein CBS101457_003743 [Exobasidium rhododendri]|nr:hypothetical protein CBS101457_003743 [Exobasidium rhododendri]